MDLRECLEDVYEMSQDHVLDRIRFTNRDQFWVDEFVIARTDISGMSRTYHYTYNIIIMYV